jgi:hypothetical protein
MIFLRPVILKDAASANSLTVDRYDYIRHLQGEVQLPAAGLLPGEVGKQIAPLDQARKQPLGQ